MTRYEEGTQRSLMNYAQHLIIPDRSGTHVLLLTDGAGWRLPRVTDPDWMLVGKAQAWAQDRLGLAIVVLRCVLVEEGETGEALSDAYLFTENLTDQTPLLGSWMDENAATSLVDERARRPIRQWFSEQREGSPRALQPWQYPGWFETVADWIAARLPATIRVDQFATWSISTVHRVETTAGRYYFKAPPTVFRHEAVVTQMLAERFPETVPRPVAIHDVHGGFLTADFGDDLVATMDPPHWEGALNALAALQRSSVASVESLLRSGCVDRRPARLQAEVEEFAADGAAWLPEAMVRRLQAALPRFRDLCEEIAASPIPNTLVHGDFHSENVAVNDGRYLIFDWTDACIAHPFVDLATFLHHPGTASKDQLTRERLRDRYLQGWSDLVSHEVVSNLFERALPLAAMHQAIAHRELLDSLDPSERWQLGSALHDWVARALAAPSLLD